MKHGRGKPHSPERQQPLDCLRGGKRSGCLAVRSWCVRSCCVCPAWPWVRWRGAPSRELLPAVRARCDRVTLPTKALLRSHMTAASRNNHIICLLEGLQQAPSFTHPLLLFPLLVLLQLKVEGTFQMHPAPLMLWVFLCACSVVVGWLFLVSVVLVLFATQCRKGRSIFTDN